MMTTIKIKEMLESVISGANVMIQGDDGVHFEAVVIAAQFEGLSKVKRQQLVYQVLNELIVSGALHALALKTYSPAEWNAIQGSDKT